MVCAPVWIDNPSLKLGDYLSVQAHKPCSISHLCSHSPNDVPLDPQRNVSIAAERGAVRPSMSISH